MEFYNQIKKDNDILKQSQEGRAVLKDSLESLILLLSPFAPHISEELWEKTGHKTLLFKTSWPSFDSKLASEGRVTVVVQVNGKLRSRFQVATDTPEDTIRETALKDERIVKFLGGKEIRKVIAVKNKLVNIVV